LYNHLYESPIYRGSNQEFEKKVVEYLTTRNRLLSITPDLNFIPKSITRLIKSITDSDYRRRPDSCVALRNLLSNLVVPDWLKVSENEYIVNDWKGKDYRIFKDNKKVENWIFESSKSFTSSFRKNSKINSLEQAIEFINNQK
jgi:7-cyano-7-deazaguanine synthase in queuosine biosynthesis